MKVLMIGPLPIEMGGVHIGGVATVVKELSKQFAEDKSIDFHLFGTNVYAESPEKWIEIKKNYTIYKSIKVNNYFKMFGFDFLRIIPKHFLSSKSDFENYYKGNTTFLLIRKIIQRINPDLIHVHHAHTLPIIAYLACNGKIPIVTTLHSFHTLIDKSVKELNLQKNLFRKNFEISSKLIAVSSHIQGKSFKLGAFAKKVIVIPNGVDVDFWKPIQKDIVRKKLNINLDKKIILFTGNLQKRKGVDVLLKSMPYLLKKISDVELVIVGSGEEKDNLIKLTKELNLERFVKFTGRVSDEEIKLWYNACDVFCVPSREEAFGIIYLEAMACGKPVIGPDVGGPKEIIQDSKNGFLFKNEDSKDLADKIIKILNNEVLAEKFGKKSRELIEKEYNWDKIAEKTKEVYFDILNESV